MTPALADGIQTRGGDRKCQLPDIEQCRLTHLTSSPFPLLTFLLEQIERGWVKDLWLAFIKTIYFGVIQTK